MIRETRGVNVHRTTAAKAFKHYGLAVRWRTTRSVMPLTDEVKKERFDICAKWKYLPVDHFVKNVDFIMDNKQWDIPTSGKARKHLQKIQSAWTPPHGAGRHAPRVRETEPPEASYQPRRFCKCLRWDFKWQGGPLGVLEGAMERTISCRFVQGPDYEGSAKTCWAQALIYNHGRQ